MKKTNKKFNSTCCDIQGALFLPDQIQQAFLGKNKRQSIDDYKILPGLTLKEECSRAFRIAQASWDRFKDTLTRTDLSEADRLSRTKEWGRIFFNSVLGYTIQSQTIIECDERQYPVAFLVSNLPVTVVSAPAGLDDARPELTVIGGSQSKKSAFTLVQDLLNADTRYKWGFAFNGTAVRLVRDAMSLTRPGYLEFNLQEILANDDYAEFLHLWMALHASRAELIDGNTAWDLWIKEGEEAGQPAREALRGSITEALLTFGQGFIAHPENEALRKALSDGSLSAKDYTHELLRLMYRFLFVFCLEERNLINIKDDSKKNQAATARYLSGYALHRFRDQSLKSYFRNRYSDAWESVKIVFQGLDNGEPLLALPALGGLFASDECPHLKDTRLSNVVFFNAMKLMRWATINGTYTAIDYKNLGTEELGSIYESLLELVPVADPQRREFSFLNNTVGSSERKKTGSYYTPDSLVQNLIKIALDPVIEKRLSDNPSDPQEALLSLRVIDPACGSGHFLLAAARRIAEQLAKVRSLDGIVTPQSYRNALREVIQHCIYGVDMNPLAVELARMALWLEGFAENKPLSFLDHHLKVGNSLVGVMNLKTLKLGIPKEAYKASGNDIKAICTAISKRNNAALKSLQKLASEETLDLFVDTRQDQLLSLLETMPSSTLDDEKKKAKAYQKYLNTVSDDRMKKACDLLIGAFMCRKTEETQDLVPTSEILWRVIEDSENLLETDDSVIQFASNTCTESSAFHWPLEFPLVFANGGFDCVLGNPPWEKAKVEDVKWFENRYPEVAQAQNASVREKMIEAMAQGKMSEDYLELPASSERSAAERKLFTHYQTALHRAGTMASFCHLNESSGGRFPLTGCGDTNLFAYFAELALMLKSSQGSVGMVLPAGIITDNATQAFSRYIFEGHVRSIFHFSNVGGLFPIHRSYTFLLMTLFDSDEFDCVFYASRIEDIDNPSNHVIFRKGDFDLFNPNTHTCVLVRTQQDLDLCRKIYNSSPILLNETTESGVTNNPWNIRFMSRMFHMSEDSGLFHSEYDSDSLVPLYQGRMIHQFDNRWATYEKINDSKEARLVTQTEKANPYFKATPLYWVNESDVQNAYKKGNGEMWWKHPWMLCFRKITSTTNERTAIVSILPSNYGASDSTTLVFPEQTDSLAACLLGNLNSLIVDYICRIKQSSASLSMFIFNQLPVLSPEQYKREDVSFINYRVAQLTRNSNEINHIWLTEHPSYVFQSRRDRLLIRAELDAYYAKLYGLTRDELRYILDPEDIMGEGFHSVTFPGLKRNETKEFGEYLTRRLVLEAFDALESGTLH